MVNKVNVRATNYKNEVRWYRRFLYVGGALMTFYQLLLVVHILSAIIGLGPGFVMIYIVTFAQSMEELRYSYRLRHRIHIFVMIGGIGLLITGIWMGILHPYLLKTGWYVVSFILYMVALAMGPFVLKPLLAPIKKFLNEASESDTIPKPYEKLARRLFFWERFEMILFIVIIFLMILKPF